MKRYLNSFLITLVLYSGVIFVLFTFFNNEKILLKKEKPLSQTISLQHIELLPVPKPEKKLEKKVEKKVEKIIEKPKEIIKKEVVKKIKPKKKIKKVVKKKIVKKPKKVVKKKLIKKKVLKTKHVVKEVKKQVQVKSKKQEVVRKIVKEKVVKRDIKKEYLSKHLSMIRAYIKKNVRYPKSAKRLRIQGIVNIKFTLRSNGVVDNIVILNGHSRLKKSTINAVKDAASSFPKIKKDITIQLPIEYKLI